MRSVVDLAQPDGPTKHHELAVRDIEVDAVDGLEAVAVDLFEISESEDEP